MLLLKQAEINQLIRAKALIINSLISPVPLALNG